MPPLSDRQSDAFDNPAKMACREGNLRVLREAAYLLWEDGDRTRLRCDWCELMGATGLLTLDVLEREAVLAAGGFTGVLGAFEIYRGAAGGHRMANLRIV